MKEQDLIGPDPVQAAMAVEDQQLLYRNKTHHLLAGLEHIDMLTETIDEWGLIHPQLNSIALEIITSLQDIRSQFRELLFNNQTNTSV